MKRKYLKLTLLLLILFCLGCGSIYSVYSGTKGFFFPQRVDMQKADLSPEERKLAELFFRADQELQAMIRELKTYEKNDPPRSADYFYSQFEYVNWVAISDLQGNLDTVYPKDLQKRLEKENLLKDVQKKYPRKLQLGLPEKKSKTDMWILKPLLKDYSLNGYIILGIDFQSLINYNHQPEKLLVLTPGRILWPGRYKTLTGKIKNQNWEKKLQNSVKGNVNIAKQRFFWFARYIGIDPIVYLMRQPGKF